jgi:hypothetical protein
MAINFEEMEFVVRKGGNLVMLFILVIPFPYIFYIHLSGILLLHLSHLISALSRLALLLLPPVANGLIGPPPPLPAGLGGRPTPWLWGIRVC